jgi:hypothetical protein
MQICKRLLAIAIVTCLLNACVPPPLSCVLQFEGFEKRYEFNMSKDKLKDKIIEAYSYDKSVGSKLLGAHVIEEAAVEREFRKSLDTRLDKSNWDEFKSEIRQGTTDTLHITIGQHIRCKATSFLVLIDGDNTSSTVTIQNLKYHQRKNCKRDMEHYENKFSDRIESKFIKKLY